MHEAPGEHVTELNTSSCLIEGVCIGVCMRIEGYVRICGGYDEFHEICIM